MSKRLFLIDAMAQIYRAHFAMSKNPLYTSKGENVSAVFGFTNILMSLIQKEKPDLLAVVYDSPQPTFRHFLHKEYKATREKMPEELVAQLPRIDQVIEALGLTKVILPGFEADDLVGTLAHRAGRKDLETYLVTGDKDYYQLVQDNVLFYNLNKGLNQAEILDPEGVKRVFGVWPEQVIDMLALMGDTSDNVPGVPKIGKKTAIKLLETYETLEQVLSNWEKIGGKIGENLRDFHDQALLSKDLVTIRLEAPITVDLEKLTIGEWNSEQLRDLFLELEFKILSKFINVEPRSTRNEDSKVSYKAVTTESALDKLIQKLRSVPRFAIDTETTSKNPMTARLVGISFSCKPGEAWYIPVNHFYFRNQPKPPREGNSLDSCRETTERVLQKLRPILESGPGKVAQNAKYDFLVLRRHGVRCAPLVFDTMLADYLLNPGARGHSLDSMALNYLKLEKIPTKDLIGKGKDEITMDMVPLKQITHYGCEDADVTFRLMLHLEPHIGEFQMKDLLEEVELPLSGVLLEMEHNGIKLDVECLNALGTTHKKRMAELVKECYELAGTPFNLGSPKQLSHILFEKLNLPTSLARKTKTGFSTDQRVLERLAPLDPLPKKILEYRSLQKLVSTYIDTLPKLVHPETGRVHTSYNQAVAATGRLSSADPNLQNIPIRTEQGAEIRKAFIAEKGFYLLSADYSQIELRMMAHLSGDKNMIEDFMGGADIHRATAAKIFEVSPDEVTREQRSASKAVNFGVLFGMREYGLSSRLKISIDQAKEFINGYFGAYPQVELYIENLLERARKDGYVSTILGRRRPMPELHSSNGNVRQQAERMTIATAVQGSAADLIKMAMIRIQSEIDLWKLPYRMLLQVHDELVLEIPVDTLDEASGWVKSRMENAMSLDVPVIVDVGHGTNWLEAH